MSFKRRGLYAAFAGLCLLAVLAGPLPAAQPLAETFTLANGLQVVEEERRVRTDNDPASLLGEQIDAMLYLAHAYHKPVIGWMAEINKLTRQDAIAFYKAHYTPANAVLIVAGDVTLDEVKKLAEEHYGKLTNTFDVATRTRTEEPEPLAPRRVTLTDARAASPVIQRTYLTVSYATAQKGEAEA